MKGRQNGFEPSTSQMRTKCSPSELRPYLFGCESVGVPDFAVESLAQLLLPSLQAFFDSPEGRSEFKRWKAEHKDTST